MEHTGRNSLAEDQMDLLSNILTTHIDVFRTSFSLGPRTKVEPLKIDLAAKARPVLVRLQAYS